MARNLLNRSQEALGVDQKVWIKLETGGYGDEATGGTLPLAADAIEHISTQMTYNIPREDSAARSGRSLVTRLSGKKEVEVKYEGYIIPGAPSGVNPTLPPAHPVILSAFGNVDLTNPAKIIYKLSRLNDKSFRMLEELTHYSRLAVGCVVDSLTFTLPGDGKAQMAAEGFAQDVYASGQTDLSSAVTAGDSFFKVAVGEGQLFEVDSYVDIVDAADGSTILASAKKITSIVGGVTEDTINVSGPVLPACASGSIVIGHAPSTYDPITSENALLGLKGSFTMAGLGTMNCQLLSAEIAIANNFTKKDFVYGESKICGYIPDKRRNVSVKLSVLLEKDNFLLYMKSKVFEAQDLTITLEPQDIPAPMFTSSAGRTFTFHMPKVEFNIPPIEVPADKYVTLELEGMALATDINNTDDEFTLTIE